MNNIKKTYVVLGAQFGDEGKGITTDWLCSRSKNPIVVRFSGGQQAGHTVIYNDVKHIHSSFGSGTLRGVPTYFTEDTTFYLSNMINELQVLKLKNITPELYLHPLAKATTPYDVAYNKARESFKQHGSCGIGVGATMNRTLNTGYKLYAIDFENPILLNNKLNKIAEYYNKLVATEDNIFNIAYFRFLISEIDYFNECLEKIPFKVCGYQYLKKYEELIFEGSQGILLDMDHGVFPNVTYSNTTSKNAIKICKLLNIGLPDIYYVTRCYQTRHGYGWMSNENEIKLINNNEEINVFNEWQKNFRIGELDYELIKYAYHVDNIYSEEIDSNSKHLVITCLDQRPDFVLNTDLLPKFAEYIGNDSPTSSTFGIYVGYLDALAAAEKMMDKKIDELPEIAVKYARFLIPLHGGGHDTVLLAYTRYNQAVLGMPCSNEHYIIPENELIWFETKNLLHEKFKKTLKSV